MIHGLSGPEWSDLGHRGSIRLTDEDTFVFHQSGSARVCDSAHNQLLVDGSNPLGGERITETKASFASL